MKNPKICYKCGQPLDRHQDAYCETLLAIWGEPAKPRPQKPYDPAQCNLTQGVKDV